MESIIYTVTLVALLAILAALLLAYVAKKFVVIEDERIDIVEDILPGVNCGGCGFSGCRPFAEACVNATEMKGLHCPVGGDECMSKVASVLGRVAEKQAPLVAVLRCNGCTAHRPQTTRYDGVSSCTVGAMLYQGSTGCGFGCLGAGDCVDACDFDAMYMNQETGLPVVIDENCVACNGCVVACPKDLLELRIKHEERRKIYVACQSQDKGAVAKKACATACIGCNKCFQVCEDDAITVENNLAFIHSDKCTLCRKCVPVCPTQAIIEEGFDDAIELDKIAEAG